MRAARLARFDLARSSADGTDGTAVQQNELSSPAQTEETGGDAQAQETFEAHGIQPDRTASVEPTQQHQSHPEDPMAGFLSLPEGAFLRLTAQVDLGSACALVATGGIAKEHMPAALGALRCAIDKAKEEHRSTTAEIDAERVADQERHGAQQNAMTQALAALAPLRTGRTQERFGEQLQELFGVMEEGAHGASEREAEFDTRTAEAAAALRTMEAVARRHVAAGELNAIAVTA
jgi:hypothetical protein